MDSEATDISNSNDSDDAVNMKKVKNAKLRALLDGLDLTPEQTKDDIEFPNRSAESSRDREILGDVPPHHGG
jgi:hypothetical protein